MVSHGMQPSDNRLSTSNSLAGHVAFITGAGRGQGRNHAVRLAQQGANIIAVDVCADLPTVEYPMASHEDLEETERLVREAGGEIVTGAADVRDPAALVAVLDEGVKAFGRLDAVSANAGIFSAAPLLELSDATWEETIGVCLTGVWNTCKAAIPHILAGNRGGSIVLTSSTAGLVGGYNMPHYIAAKHGVVGLMRALALELAPHMIRVNTVHPTQTDTMAMHNDACYKLFCPDIEHPTREDVSPRSIALNALPIDWNSVDDISNAVLFLMSDAARHVTGVALPVDAGAAIKRPS